MPARRLTLSIYFVLCVSLFFCFFKSSTLHAADPTLKVTVIPQAQVKEYVINLFRTPLVKSLAQKQGTIIHDLILKIEKYPLFVFTPPEHPAARLNFTAYLRLLALRHTQYENALTGDLYLLHELHHLGTMPYGLAENFSQWNTKMTLNEKESSLFSEALVHFAFPEIRSQFAIKDIWVDRFLTEKIRLRDDLPNQELYKKFPEEFRQLLLKRSIEIGKHTFAELDSIEQRSWVYDRSNEMWSQVYWKWAPMIESHMKEFYKAAATRPEIAAQDHVRWLSSITSWGLVLPEPALEFHRFYKRLENLQLNPMLQNFCERCETAAKTLDQLVEASRVEATSSLPAAQQLLKYGVSGIVYSLPFPETKAITEKAWKETSFDEIYGHAYTRKQDAEHRPFLDAYREWAKPVVKGLENFKYAYATNGSNEAIKDSLALLRTSNPTATLHLFEGEYEGVTAYATALGIEIKRHPRNMATILFLSNRVKPGDVFYISQPSSLDGNVWPMFDQFMRATKAAGLRVMVDLAYVGTVAKNFEILLNYPNIDTVFFSLSKTFGTYYQRIGGVFSKTENPMLVGNKWFKNTLSLRIGTALLKNVSVYELPRKYLWAQKTGVLELSKMLGMKVRPSDVVLLANVKSTEQTAPELLKALYRGAPADSGYIRFCLTPMMSLLIDEDSEIDRRKACDEALRAKK